MFIYKSISNDENDLEAKIFWLKSRMIDRLNLLISALMLKWVLFYYHCLKNFTKALSSKIRIFERKDSNLNIQIWQFKFDTW